MLSVLVPVTGDLLRVERPASELLEWIIRSPEAEGDDIEWILVLDGPQWNKVFVSSQWQRLRPNIRLTALHSPCGHQGVLLNHGLRVAQGRFVAFAWPGCEMAGRVGVWKELCREAEDGGDSMVAGFAPDGERQAASSDSWLAHPDQAIRGYHRGWLQMQNLAPMSNCVVRMRLFETEGAFSPSILLQRFAWWEFTLRISRSHPVGMRDSLRSPDCRWGWHNYPLNREAPISGDLAARLMGQDLLPKRTLEESLEVNADGLEDLIKDLDLKRARRLLRYLHKAGAPVERIGTEVARIESQLESPVPAASPHGCPAWKEPLRMVLIGDVHAPVHHQLYFLNFFRKLRTQGRINWRIVLDTVAHPSDVEDAGLVVFTRIRSDAGRELLDYCKKRGLRTLYMLDDNWFWIGKDVPEVYGEMFKPGAPSYENFLYCCKSADTVLTFNPVLAEDLLPHAKRLVRMRFNIDLDLFHRRLRSPNRPVRLGYIGSTRWAAQAFEGLVEAAERNESVDLFVMTNEPPEALKRLPPERYIYQRYVYSYERYAQTVCEAAPDVVVAPLLDCRYQQSKLPIKTIDSAAVGAACVYSRVEPYRSLIRDGETGLFADDTAESWRKAILRLVQDGALRKRIARNALKEVERDYRTEVVLPQFLKMLELAAFSSDEVPSELTDSLVQPSGQAGKYIDLDLWARKQA